MEEKQHHCDCHSHEQHSNCNFSSHSHEENENLNKKYKDFEFDDETDFTCDLDPNKVCDNCGKCLDAFNTDKEGYVQIQIDKIEKGDSTLQDLYKMYGLDDNQ